MEKRVLQCNFDGDNPTIGELIKNYARNRQSDLTDCSVFMASLLFNMQMDKTEFLTYWAPLLDQIRKDNSGLNS
jgi:hypothetical protein